MCGLTGIIFGKKERSLEDYHELSRLFTSMFILSEQRGHHASGVATLNTRGKASLFKIPVPPTRLVEVEGYNNVLETLNNNTTILMGHSRWKTVGSEYNNYNNQPIIAGSILGTHNGTITNASSLFARNRFKRKAEVDSEILFRMADASIIDGSINATIYKNYIAECHGNLSCVVVSKTDPCNVFLLKGSKPLSLYYNARLQVIAYSSIDGYIKDSVETDDWVSLIMPENKMYQTCFDDFNNVVADSFSFVKSIPKPKAKQTQLFLDF